MYGLTPATNHAILMRLVGNSMGNQKIGRVARFSTANEQKHVLSTKSGWIIFSNY